MIKPAKNNVPNDVLRALRGASEAERILHRLHSVALVLNGFSCSEVGRFYGDSPRSVAYWLQRFEKSGVDGLREEQRSGRPKTLSELQTKQLQAYTKGQQDARRITANRIAQFIRQKFGISLTTRQCQRILNGFGFSAKGRNTTE